MIEWVLGLVIVCLLGAIAYLVKQIGTLVNKVMSGNYTTYIQNEAVKKELEKPSAPMLSFNVNEVDETEKYLNELNSLTGSGPIA